jgi:hypothetical protein
VDQKPSILTSTRLPRARGINSLLLLKSAVANLILGVCESFLNTRYFIQQNDGTGNLPALEADVKTSEMGRIVVFPAPAGGGGGIAGVSNLIFRGEYDPTATYSLQNVVIVSMGSNAGTFVCLQTSTGNNPWAGGGYWCMLPQGQLGVWM